MDSRETQMTASRNCSGVSIELRYIRVILVLLFTSCIQFGTAINLEAEEQIDFAKDIRPILSENCFFCHGPDEKERQADLRLDTAQGVWSVVERGHSEQSELFRRTITADHDLLMPPPESNRQLNPGQIETLKKWIDQGAAWEQHWSFTPIKKAAVPQLSTDSGYPVHNPIDAFVQSRLKTSKLTPSPEADKQTLIRRLSLDLTGLPPTPDQTQHFLDDKAPDAYEDLVDRLLDSKHFGQRMAWDWLDAARYADTNGYQGDRERTMWPWRDWVVDAFNKNLPYNQFTLWQIAGDLLPNASYEQKLATAFNRNHMINGEGGRIAEENRVEYVMDMTETMGTVWLGMTLNCCRCHDHKYDPILNEEYYQFFAFFNQTGVNGAGGNAQTPPILPAPTEQQKSALNQLEDNRAQKSKLLEERKEQLRETEKSWQRAKLMELTGSTTWRSLRTIQSKAKYANLKIINDNTILSEVDPESSQPADNDTYTLTVDFAEQASNRSISSLRLDVLRHPNFGGSLSHADSGNFVLTDFKLRVVDQKGAATREEPIRIQSAQASFEQGSHAITAAFDDNTTSGWAVYEGKKVDRDHAAVFHLQSTLELNSQERLEITLAHDSPHVRHNIGHFQLTCSDDPTAALDDTNRDLLIALKTKLEERTETQRNLITKSHHETDETYRQLKQEIENLVKNIKSAQDSWAKVMVMADQPEARTTFLLERGLYNQPLSEVQAGFPISLLQAAPSTKPNGPSEAPLSRLELAKWLIHPEHPLTARVTVNRVWQQFFGTGLVRTSEDFGTLGEIPEHLDLLNWLAKDFLESDWNLKALIKKLVMSHTYRQSSVIPSRETYDLDPSNRLLSRASRYRLPAWMIRDQALAVSGLLSEVSEGASVNTYQPKGVWEEASFGKKQYRQDSGEKLYRRSLYVFWRRIIAPTMFFDSASRQTCTVRTGRTNTPLHALQTLNGTTYVEASRELASSALREVVAPRDRSLDEERLNWIIQRVLSRNANAQETEILLEALNRSRSRFSQSSDSALAFLSVGESPRDETIDQSELAAWTSLSLAILNFDETLNRE